MRRRVAVGYVLGMATLLACRSQPSPRFEYGPTETYTSTARDPAPRRVPDPAPADPAPLPSAGAPPAPGTAAPPPGAPADDPARADAVRPADEPAPAATSEPADRPPRWYGPKAW